MKLAEQGTIQLNQESATRNPFPGLRPFNTDENVLFFGRDGLSDALLEKLQATRFVAVVGTSGSGKSSLVRAGLLPALRNGFIAAGSDWRVALFRPINTPINNLAAALFDCGIFPANGPAEPTERLSFMEETLRRSSLGLIEAVRLAGLSRFENLLIVVDQFEELYRFEASSEVEHPKEEASAFVKLLLEATRQSDLPIYVILTMRSDYLGDSAHFWGLPEAINRGQFLIPRMDDDERREAVEGPIRVRGAKISWPLVNRLLNDAGDDPRLLPILQDTLMRTWDYWEKHRSNSEPLGLAHYDNPEVGGMSRALSIHADEAYNELTDEQKIIAEKMFKRLTEKLAGKREGRLPATVSELAQIAEVREDAILPVIEAFRKEGRCFLMPSAPSALKPDTLIDISHESLISGWTRLSDWVEEEGDSSKIYQRLVDDALRYPDETGLLTNPELECALKWRLMRRPNEVWAQRYRSQFGKDLESDNPPARPEWADTEDSEYDIAIRYLDLSKEEHDRVQNRKERQRWKYLAVVSATAILLFVLFIVASIFAKTADSERNKADLERTKADELRQIAYTEKANAERAREQADSAKQQAEEDRRLALIARDQAKAAAIEADSLRKQAVAAGMAAERQATRGNLLEEGISLDLNRNSTEAVKKYEAVRDMYVKSGESSKAAFTEILIGNTILRSGENQDAALPYFERALKMAEKGTVKVTSSVFLNIGDRIAESFFYADPANKAAQFYDFAANTIDKHQDELRADVLIRSADLYARPGKGRDITNAVDRYNKALSFLPQNSSKRILIIIRIGDAYKYSRRFDEARDAYQIAGELATRFGNSAAYGDALVLIGDTYAGEKDNSQALDYYNRAHAAYGLKDPSSASLASLVGNGRALEAIGKIYERTADTKGATDKYRQALHLYREAAKREAGENERALQRRAETGIDLLRTLVPNLEDVLLKTLTVNGIDAAIKQYRELKRNNPADYDFGEYTLNRLGYVLLRKKQVADAIEIFKLNIEVYPKQCNPYDSLGEAYMIAGNKELAILNYEKALKLDPKKQSAIDALKKLKGQ